MSITYASLVSEIATTTAISSTALVSGDNNFQGIMPAIIDYAEGRLYRELDLPAVRTPALITCTSGSRAVSLSSAANPLLVIEIVNVFVPDTNGTVTPVLPASLGVVNAIYPNQLSSNCGVPQYFARLTDTTLILGPAPDLPYPLGIIATVRPTALSASNSSTWLTQNVPELMLAASMIFASGYMRDFGAQSGNPQMALSWEGQYQALLKSQSVDTLRMKFQAEQWTANLPSPIATPPRA